MKFAVRCRTLVGVVLPLHLPVMAQKNIRSVDFKNFAYPLSGPLLGHDRLEWLDTSEYATAKRSVHLINGSSLTKVSSFVMQGKTYRQYSGFTLESISVADLTGKGQDEAIIDLHYGSGGTQTTDYVYIYTLKDRKPKLLAYCHTGSRSDDGLKNVYGKKGLLVFELLDPDKAEGDCCSSGVVISRYKWQNDRFETVGSIERLDLPPKVQ